MKKLLLVGILFLAGCAATAPTMIILVHPTTAERITCQYGGGNPHPLIVMNDQRRTEGCAQQYEALGYVRATDLSPAQKAKLSYPQPIVEQDITIRQAPPKAP